MDTASLTRTFDDGFGRLDLFDPGTGRGTWSTAYDFGGAALDDHTLAANGEFEIYVDPSTRGTAARPLGLNPFKLSPVGLTIRASRTPAPLRRLVWGRRYVSGLLTTRRSFTQTYGYFEICAALPQVRGAWPAFWLLPADGRGVGEIDVMEAIGGDAVYHTVHSGRAAVDRKVEFETRIDDLARFHAYGVLWSPRTIAFYVDGWRTASTPTPPDLVDRPMFMLMNLAIGGRWPGRPDPDFRSADMTIRYVRAYRLAARPAHG